MARDEMQLAALGSFIRDRRTAIGLTQVQLGERLGWVQERISLLENGKYGMPSLPGLARLANALGVPLDEVLEAVGFPVYEAHGDHKAPEGLEQSQALQYMLQRLLAIPSGTLKDTLNAASDQMAAAMGADKIDALIYDPALDSLVALGTSNTPMGRKQHAAGLDRFPIADRGRIVETFETGTPFWGDDISDDPGFSLGTKNTLGVRSMLAVPLDVGDETRGVLVAQAARPNAFCDDESRFFTAACHWVGMVAHRAEMSEVMQQSVAEEARRTAADDVITALAHDLGNFLTPISGRVDLLRRRLQQDGLAHEFHDADEIAKSVRAMRETLSRLLDVSRLDQGLFSLTQQPVDLSGLIEEVGGQMGTDAHPIDVRVSASLEVEGDPVRLREVLVNLLTNAIQHSPAGAVVAVSCDREPRDDGDWAVVAVVDEGPGIAQDVMPRLFQRFAAGRESTGMGLGLYLARRLMEAHAGTLTVVSSAGHGASFRLAMPCAAVRSEEEVMPAENRTG